MSLVYHDPKGRTVAVRAGLGREKYMSMWESASGGHHRVVSPALPERTTPEEAQADLDAYAARKKWESVEVAAE